MTAVTVEDFCSKPIDIDNRLSCIHYKKLFMVGWKLGSIPSESIAFITRARKLWPLCEDMAFDERVRNVITRSNSIAQSMNAVADRMPSCLKFAKRKWYSAAAEWEHFAEDMQLIATQEQRKTWNKISGLTAQVANHLPTWQESSLFQ